MERKEKAHILVVPYPTQGHINPMLQFSKRLVSKGLKVTFAVTVSNSKSMLANTGTIRVHTFSDGYDEYGTANSVSVETYLNTLETVGSVTLSNLIKKLDAVEEPICYVVYDSFLRWVVDVANEFSLKAASFFTQCCAVNSIYDHVQRGLITVPVEAGSVVSVPGLPPLEISDMPSFISVYGSYPVFFDLVLGQFSNLEKADLVLFNTFHQLEPEILDRMSKLWPIKTIGPTIPSKYLDGRVEGDNDYGLNLFVPSTYTCMNWLDTKEAESVVYVSFGSRAELCVEQMEELACGLGESNNYFLWVVRATETSKLPDSFIEETSEKGLVVTWSPQLEVLSHTSLGCFVTHCGWNSTFEALSLGVPMVALPQWTDQTTNAKFVQDEWKMGLRVKVDENGIARRTDIQECIREIMNGGTGKEIKMNARKWKQMAKEAVDEDGTSDKNIEEFVAKLARDDLYKKRTDSGTTKSRSYRTTQ